jgi:hypothetical protein
VGMNERQVIDLYDFNKITHKLPSGYELRVEGRFAGLAAKLWRFLIKKGLLVQSYRDVEKVTRVQLDGCDLFDKICKHYYSLLSACRDPQMVLIGPNTMAELMHLPQLREYSGGPFSFSAQGERIDMVRGGRVKRAFNLPVRVVSQMEGVVIVDRER